MVSSRKVGKGAKGRKPAVIQLSTLKKNPANPRAIRGEQFERLKRSLQSFPQMMALRPIVTDKVGVVLGGNMRLEALKALGFKEVPDEWVKRADELTEEQKREFVIKDNAGFGEWDWDALANAWDDLPLTEWGLDLPEDWKPVEAQPAAAESKYQEQYGVIVICENEAEQEHAYNKLRAEGYTCRVVVT